MPPWEGETECKGTRGDSDFPPLSPLAHPRRRGVKIFDFAVAVGKADLEAQRASNLTPSNGRCGGLPPPARGHPRNAPLKVG